MIYHKLSYQKGCPRQFPTEMLSQVCEWIPPHPWLSIPSTARITYLELWNDDVPMDVAQRNCIWHWHIEVMLLHPNAMNLVRDWLLQHTSDSYAWIAQHLIAAMSVLVRSRMT